MATDGSYDLVVVGAGPGGYVAAIRGAQLGLNVACIEKDSALGGTCLSVGCIPSKALLEASERYYELKQGWGKYGICASDVSLDLDAMMKHKDDVVAQLQTGITGLFKKNKVTHIRGTATIKGPKEVEVAALDGKKTKVRAEHILIATGSTSAPLNGVEMSGDRVGTSTEALCYNEVPKHLIVIGAGVIGLELGSVWRRLGAEVTVLEYLDRILPGMDADLATEAQKLFEQQGLVFHLETQVTGAKFTGSECIVERANGDPLTADRVLLCVGRRPNTHNLGLANVEIETDARGCIPVNDHFETSVPGIYAIGDVITGPMLAHKAEEEGVACIERIVTGYGHINYDTIPNVVYTDPEIASVGKTEQELKEAGIPYKRGVFPFLANGRARAIGHADGRVKILAHKETDRVLGAHIIGPHAGDLISELAVAMEFGASSEDIARCCHAHPTLAEVVKEAALAASGRPLHI